MSLPVEITDSLNFLKVDAVSLAFGFLIIVLAIATIKIMRNSIIGANEFNNLNNDISFNENLQLENEELLTELEQLKAECMDCVNIESYETAREYYYGEGYDAGKTEAEENVLEFQVLMDFT